MRDRAAANVGERVSDHIRSNVWGIAAVFIALTGTAYAVDGPLAGQNQVGSADIIDAEVTQDDLRNNSVRTQKVAADSLLADDLAAGSVGNSELQANAVTGGRIATGTIQSDDVSPDFFNEEIQDNGFGSYGVAPGAIHGPELAPDAITNDGVGTDGSTRLGANSVNYQEIGVDAVRGVHVLNDSLTGVDLAEATLGPSLDIKHSRSSDAFSGEFPFASTSQANPSTILSESLPAGTYLVFAELMVGASDDTGIGCSIWTGTTKQEESFDDVQFLNKDHMTLIATRSAECA
jgi:hypothetical protein